MRTAAAIAVAGAIGALARYGLEGLVSRRAPGAFPWGTFAVNVSGAFVLGFVFTVMTEQFTVAPWIRGAVTIGLLGAYTTFSRSEEHTSELQSQSNLVCRLLLEKKNKQTLTGHQLMIAL